MTNPSVPPLTTKPLFAALHTTEVTAPSWYAKMTAADTVFVAPKSLTNASVTQAGVVLTAPLDYAQMPALNMATVTTEPASADKDGKVLRAKR